jgi:hypothetical protein
VTFQVIFRLLTPVLTSQVTRLQATRFEGDVVERMRGDAPALSRGADVRHKFREPRRALMPSSLVMRTVAAMSLMAIGLSLVSPSPRSENVSDGFPFLDQRLFKIRAMEGDAPSP